MADYNQVTLIGRLTADPQIRYTRDGKPITEFSIANNYYISSRNSNEVNYFNIIAFGKLAETVQQYLVKGKQIAIMGKLRQERWQDRNTNKTQSRIFIILESLQMLGSKDEANKSK